MRETQALVMSQIANLGELEQAGSASSYDLAIRNASMVCSHRKPTQAEAETIIAQAALYR